MVTLATLFTPPHLAAAPRVRTVPDAGFDPAEMMADYGIQPRPSGNGPRASDGAQQQPAPEHKQAA